MKILTQKGLCQAAKEFCQAYNGVYTKEIFGITDGKAIGTYVEHLFKAFLNEKYGIVEGSSASGIDLPHENTDIKVTSIIQPQSSCPYRNSRQKIYGLGYNILLFVYRKEDNIRLKKGALYFVNSSFIKSERTADYQTTRGIADILIRNGNIEDVYAFLNDRQVPGDEITLMNLAEEIIKNPPKIGYLTISNALQWRLQYSRVVNLNQVVQGITTILNNVG